MKGHASWERVLAPVTFFQLGNVGDRPIEMVGSHADPQILQCAKNVHHQRKNQWLFMQAPHTGNQPSPCSATLLRGWVRRNLWQPSLSDEARRICRTRTHTEHEVTPDSFCWMGKRQQWCTGV